MRLSKLRAGVIHLANVEVYSGTLPEQKAPHHITPHTRELQGNLWPCPLGQVWHEYQSQNW
jgi:hypothetical protein